MIVYSNKDFIIKKSSNNDYVLIRKKLNKHSHFNSLTGARKLIKMLYKRIYTENEYLKVLYNWGEIYRYIKEIEK